MKRQAQSVDEVAYRKAKSQAWDNHRVLMVFNFPFSLISGFLMGVTLVAVGLKLAGSYSELLLGIIAGGVVPVLVVLIYRKIEWFLVKKYIVIQSDRSIKE